MNGQKDIFDIFKKASYDDLKQALSEWLDPEGETNEEAPQAQSTNTEAQSTTKKVDDVNAAFDELFNN